jgi:hypothetical protein
MLESMNAEEISGAVKILFHGKFVFCVRSCAHAKSQSDALGLDVFIMTRRVSEGTCATRLRIGW